jgi:hypothetical protein
VGVAAQVLHFIVIAGMREDILAMAQDFERSHVSTGLGYRGEFRRASCRNIAEGAEQN